MTEIVITAAKRTPVGSFLGAFAATPAHELGRIAIEAALEQAGVAGEDVSEVILGQVLTAAQGQNPARTIAKYEAFADLAPDSDAARAFVRLEDWANAGAPLPYAAAASLFEDCIADDLPGKGQWKIAGTPVDPRALACPTVEFVSLSDRIVPAATAIGLADRRDLGAGHVGMIVGRSARAHLWEPLANWIAALD